ncbi:MAG TPA: amino acid adenylation domain-containing protein [Blastocatellia bacterium]|nr:amino acid adenylation domain-containing protein [Blastocatellia bacterium]
MTLQPHHPAVIAREGQLTYAELNAQANQLAHYLRTHGAGPETLIPICVDRSEAMAIGILGILKAGAAFVPIDPAYPPERIAFMLADTNARFIVTQMPFLAPLQNATAQVIALDRDRAVLAQQSTANPAVVCDGHHLSYIIYTSGSTGKPKGTMMTQTNLSHYVLALQAELQLKPQDRYLHLASLAFSSARRHLLLPLAHGATVVIADEELRLDPLPLFRMIKEQGVTVFDAVPSFQRHCTNALLELETDQRRRLLTNDVRFILSASEPLLSDIPKKWLREFQHPAQHIHMFGQTETSGIVALHRITNTDIDGAIRPIPVGRPIANTEILLLDEHQQPVATGEPGEIYIRSTGVGRSYLNQPELTASKFLASSTLCRTGDFARLRADGLLECMGRQDAQVKLRGYRVELNEIEAVLMKHAAVRECAVLAREDEPNQKQLVAYVVVAQQTEAIRHELHELAQRELPDYMVPAAFVRLTALPRTPNGKIDRRGLPAPTVEDYHFSTNYEAPLNATEATIADIWAEVLGLPRIGRHEPFFALGGHSLLAGQIVARVRKAFQTDLPLRVFFAAPTVAGLAEAVAKHQPNARTTLTPRPRHEALPLSFAQQRLWFLEQLDPGTATYNLSKVMRLTGAVDAAALRQALSAMAERHEVLRTRFCTVDGTAQQVIEAAVSLPFTTATCTDQDDVEAMLQSVAAEPFDLTTTPLWRVHLLQLRPSEHLLVVVVHHIISDGWSVGVFWQELGALYQMALRGESLQLAALPVQYADYSLWQREELSGTALAEQVSFWRKHLDGAPALLELPTDKPRPAEQRYRGAQVTALLPSSLRDGLQKLAQESDATLFMTLLAAFQVLLMRYSQQEQIVVGTPIAGRTQAELEPLLGFFVNTLALRGDLSGNPSFQALLQRTRKAALAAYTYQELPFEKLVEELQPVRSLSYAPIFQVMFALQNAPSATLDWGTVQLQPQPLPHRTAKFDLSLDMYEQPDGLQLLLEYDTDLFETATVQRMLEHFRVLLEAVLQNAQQPITTLPLVAEGERALMLEDWNQDTVPIPSACLHELMEAQARRTPDAIAVVWEHQRITYCELNARANQLAHYLQAAGVVPETIVGLCVERSIEMVIGVLGILKAGGAYLPLDPNYPQERLAYKLSDAQVNILVTQEKLRSVLPAHSAQVILLDADWPRIQQESSLTPQSSVTNDNLAYVIYTSGSTGRAKGVRVCHRNVVNAFAAWEAAYQLANLRSHLQMASFSFDVFTGDLTRALCSGAQLVLCPTELLLDPEAMYQLLQHEQVDAAEFVPVVIRSLLEYLELEDLSLDGFKLLVVGSDIWLMDEYRRLRKRCGPATRLISSYGVTEATIDSTYFEATTADLHTEGIVPIGRPFANTQMFVLDTQQNPVPIGVPGELYIGGAGITRGYLNRPELTTEKFIALNGQIAKRKAQVLYRTGDLARYRADGTLEIIGRADNQVKLRGYRIELGEIEATLARHPDVKECVVLVREDAPGDRRLIAYYNAKEPAVAASALRAWVKTQLPDHMVPSAFVLQAAWPLMPNGKIDRRALPPPHGNQTATDAEYVAPRSIFEIKVALIWAQLLKVERVGLYDNFFALGGHSLLATQVMARIRAQFKIELSLKALFETPTVAGLAERILSTIQSGRGLQARAILPVPGSEESPQSYAQQRLWFLDQFDPGNSVYNLPVLLRVEGAVDTARLEQSINNIIARHEILRTTFTLQHEEPVQCIADAVCIQVTTTDVSSLEHADETALQQIKAFVAQPFELQTGPLLRAQVWQPSATTCYLAFVFHHIVSDGWSVGIFLKELGLLYQAGSEAELPALPIQYRDYAVWQHQQLQGDVLAELLQFWKQHLAGAPALLTLPTDHPRPALQRFRGAQVSALLPGTLHEALQELSKREGVTLFMTLLAAFQVLLMRLSQQEQIVIGTPIASRTQVETEPLIGFFVNTLALQGDLSGNPTWQELLQRTRNRALEAYAHQALPFEKLVEELQPSRSLRYTPIFQVMFALQNTPSAELHWGSIRLRPIKLASQTAKFDLSLDAFEEADGLRLWLEYDTDLFNAETVEQWLQQYQEILIAVVTEPEQHIATLPLQLNTATRHFTPFLAPPTPKPARTTTIAPHTPTQAALAQMWTDLLRVGEVGIDDDFFDLGGHSLLATKVIARIRDTWGVKLPLRTMFEAPTIAGLATDIEEFLAVPEQEDDLDQLLAELEAMSEDEALRLLARA